MVLYVILVNMLYIVYACCVL